VNAQDVWITMPPIPEHAPAQIFEICGTGSGHVEYMNCLDQEVVFTDQTVCWSFKSVDFGPERDDYLLFHNITEIWGTFMYEGEEVSYHHYMRIQIIRPNETREIIVWPTLTRSDIELEVSI
jgi:rRNA maturation protein Rpf1